MNNKEQAPRTHLLFVAGDWVDAGVVALELRADGLVGLVVAHIPIIGHFGVLALPKVQENGRPHRHEQGKDQGANVVKDM